jgi:hypothetical protein
MKTLFAIAAIASALVIAGTAYAQEAYGPWNEDQACSGGTCTRSPATPVGTLDGMRMSSTKGYRVSVCAVSGQTLSGAGTLLAWRYNAARLLWERNKDLDRAVAVSGVRCAAFADTPVPAQIVSDRVLYAASGVTVSGGATINVRVDLSDL